MKWILGLVLAAALTLVIYIGSAVVAVGHLVTAVRHGDAAAIMARTNLPRVRHAMVDQVIDAYLAKQANSRLSPFKRMAVGAYGATVADAMIGKLMTADNLSALLRTGAVQQPADSLAIQGLPPLADLDVDRVLMLLRRFEYVKPVEFAIRLGQPTDDAAVSLHFEDWTWRLSGVRLPSRVLSELVGRLPAP